MDTPRGNFAICSFPFTFNYSLYYTCAPNMLNSPGNATACPIINANSTTLAECCPQDGTISRDRHMMPSRWSSRSRTIRSRLHTGARNTPAPFWGLFSQVAPPPTPCPTLSLPPPSLCYFPLIFFPHYLSPCHLKWGYRGYGFRPGSCCMNTVTHATMLVQVDHFVFRL